MKFRIALNVQEKAVDKSTYVAVLDVSGDSDKLEAMMKARHIEFRELLLANEDNMEETVKTESD